MDSLASRLVIGGPGASPQSPRLGKAATPVAIGKSDSPGQSPIKGTDGGPLGWEAATGGRVGMPDKQVLRAPVAASGAECEEIDADRRQDAS